LNLPCDRLFLAGGSQRSWKERAMHDLLIALIFVTLVASPVIVAALPMRESDDALESHTGNVDLRVPSPSASR
jgi:hypothetical protein